MTPFVGLAISEEEYLASADVIAKQLLPHGYEYAVVDYLWYRRKVPGVYVDSLGFDVRAREDRFFLRFTRADDQKQIFTGGPWFYGTPNLFWRKEAVEKVGLTLGFVEHTDKLSIKRGLHARVKTLHKLCDPMKEAFGGLPFEFGSICFPVKLQVKYDRTVGYYRVCGLMAHPDSLSCVDLRP
ncbi:hypothetical protein ACLB2K_047528 [Fragaria x ananassa]